MSPVPVYLDHAATTPALPEVLEAILPFFAGEGFGNPSSAHRFGRTARAGVEEARREVAEAVGAEPGGVVFTSGGSEANNLAIVGAALAARTRGGPFRVAVSAVEHKSTLGAAHFVEELGGEALELPVDSAGRVVPEGLDRALERGLALVSVMAVNNETGVLQDTAALAQRCATAGVPLHCDAVQAMGKFPVSVTAWGCAALTLSGHKLGAPKGAAALVLRDRAMVRPILHGGTQQHGLRPGTENVPGIVGLGVAARLASRGILERRQRLVALRDRFEASVLEQLPDAVIHGRDAARAPHISLLSVPGTDSEAMLMHLDLAGIAASSGSACMTGAVEPSHVLTAMGVPRDLGAAALRFSFATASTVDDVAAAVEALAQAAAKVRRLASVLGRG